MTLLIAGSFGGFAAFISGMRSKDARLVPITTIQAVVKIAFSIVSIVSEAFLCGAFYSEGGKSKALGTIVVFFRLLHGIPTLLILSFVFLKYKYFKLPQWLDALRMYRGCFAHDHFLASIYPYAALSLLACLDSTLVAFLPWLFTEFSFQSGGFPNMFALRYTNFYKIFQDVLRFLCNVIYIVFTGKSQNASISAFLGINMIVSVISIVLAFMVAVMKASALYQIEKNGGTLVTNKDDYDEEDGNTSGSNPLHTKESRDLSIRQWLLLHMPGADNPSIHAVDQAFKRDGILTVGDLADCIQGNVLDIAEMKNYTREGRFAKKDTLALLNAIEKIMDNKRDRPKHRDSSVRGKMKPDGKRMSTLAGMFGVTRRDVTKPKPVLEMSGIHGKNKEVDDLNASEEASLFAAAIKEMQQEQKKSFEEQLRAHKEQADKKIKAQERQLQVQTEAIVNALHKLDQTIKSEKLEYKCSQTKISCF